MSTQVFLQKRDNAVLLEMISIYKEVYAVYFKEKYIPETFEYCRQQLRNLLNKQVYLELSPALYQRLKAFLLNIEYEKLIKYTYGYILRTKKQESLCFTEDVLAACLKEDFDINVNDYKDFQALNEAFLSKLSNSQLLSLFARVTYLVGIEQHPKYRQLYIFKYSKLTSRHGHNALTRVCRGIVVDVDTLEVVSNGYDKFHNLGEDKETKLTNVQNALNQATIVYLSDKLDGNNIVITKTKKFGTLMHTNGGFDETFLSEVRSIVNEKYPKLYENLAYNYSYMFELIAPQFKVLIDYQGERSLTLTNIRHLPTGRLIGREALSDFASLVNIPITTEEKFSSLEDLLDNYKLPHVGKEGWVCRITLPTNEELLFKLKTEDYINLYYTNREDLGIYSTYQMIYDNAFDDFYANVQETAQKKLDENVELINSYIHQAADIIKMEKVQLIEELQLDVNNLLRYKKKLEGAYDEDKAREDIKKATKAVKSYSLSGFLLKTIIDGSEPEVLLSRANLQRFKEVVKLVDIMKGED